MSMDNPILRLFLVKVWMRMEKRSVVTTTIKHLKAMKARDNNGVTEYQVNGEWLSEEAISERLEENTRLRTEVERLDELRRKERELTAMFDSDQRVAMALLDYVRNRLK